MFSHSDLALTINANGKIVTRSSRKILAFYFKMAKRRIESRIEIDSIRRHRRRRCRYAAVDVRSVTEVSRRIDLDRSSRGGASPCAPVSLREAPLSRYHHLRRCASADVGLALTHSRASFGPLTTYADIIEITRLPLPPCLLASSCRLKDPGSMKLETFTRRGDLLADRSRDTRE